MSAKYAPGPWWISGNHSDQRPEAIHCSGSNSIVATTWAIVPEEMRKASALLIAAAPELLEACEASLRIAKAWMQDAAPTAEYRTNENMEYAAAKVQVDMLEAAISKATKGGAS